MKPALIKLTKKIILNNKIKHSVLKKIYSDSINLAIELMDYSSIETWDIAITLENVVNNVHRKLNSEDNRYLKRIEKDYSDLSMGPDNSSVKVLAGKIEVLNGNISDRKSFEFVLYLTLQEFTLLNCFGNSLLVSIDNQIENLSKGVNTFLLELNDEYNIIHYQTID